MGQRIRIQRSVYLILTGTIQGVHLGAILVKHLYFGKLTNYDVQSWNVPSQLPLGTAALGASVARFSFAIPAMNQPWFKGPMGLMFGDTGSMVAASVTTFSCVASKSDGEVLEELLNSGRVGSNEG